LICLCVGDDMGKEELIEKIKSLRAKLQLAVSEYDDVDLKEATAIRIEYTEKIGQYECQQFELYLQFEELKRKIEMIQARINRGEEVDIVAIDNEIADILASHYEKLNGMRLNVSEMVSFQNGSEVDIVERTEIKRIYRKLMKILHPDVLDPALGFDAELWEKAQSAYKRNDIDTLRMIDDIVGDTENTPLESREESELIDMVSRIELAISRYQMKLGEIKKKFPFTEVQHLKNDAWVRARQGEIKKSIEEYQKSIVFLAVILKGLLNEE